MDLWHLWAETENKLEKFQNIKKCSQSMDINQHEILDKNIIQCIKGFWANVSARKTG